MAALILHIPHASTEIPSYDGFLIGEDAIKREIDLLTDWYTDELFGGTTDDKLIVPFSRVFCDVERFADDKQEPMAQYGMGALYQKTDSGETMRVISDSLREKIMEIYYWPHHNRFTEMVDNHLLEYGKATIIDCHSFAEIPFQRELDKSPGRPDFCIGSDGFHTPDELIDISLDFFSAKGYSVKLNSPYSGSIVTLKHYGNNPQVHSIMVEVNRKLYLNADNSRREDSFTDVQGILTDYLNSLRQKYN